MSTINYTPYVNGVAGTVIPLTSESCTSNSKTWRSRVSTLPPAGQVTLTITTSLSKTGVRRNRIVLNIPRMTAPVGTNPATGLPYTPTVVDSVTHIHESLTPATAVPLTINDNYLSMHQITAIGTEVYDAVRQGFALSC